MIFDKLEQRQNIIEPNTLQEQTFTCNLSHQMMLDLAESPERTVLS